jgi:sugar/nucleoside kinase (ribokinase family)
MNFLGVFGHVVIDYIIGIPRFPKANASIGIESQERYFGGTAGNLARMASRFGVKTSLASFVGEDFPKDYYGALKEDDVVLDDLHVVKGYSTPTCFVFTDGKNQYNFINQGPMRDMHKFNVLEYSVWSSEVVHIGTGRPEYYKNVANYCDELDKEIAFDPGQEIHYVYNAKKFRDMIELAKYFFCNESELKRARGFLNLKRTKQLLDYVDILIVTKGEKGSEIYAEGTKFNIPAIRPRRFVDSTGAGDAYRAGFYAALSRKFDFRKCGLAGAAASSLVVETLGPQTKIPSWDKIIARLRPRSQYRK